MTKSSDYLVYQTKIFKDKNYQEAISFLKKSDNFLQADFQELYADALFFINDFPQSAAIYEKLGHYSKEAYCYLLFGDVENAKLIWENSPKSPAQNWGLFFCQLFCEKITVAPTYLQIRSFLERDLNVFIKLNLESYVQKLIDISEYLAKINPETNKIIARTFLYNDYFEYAKEYFIRAFDFTTQDAELYYLSGVYYLKTNDITEAKSALKKAILLNENYAPAKELLLKL